MTELFDILYQFKSTGADKVKAEMDNLNASTEKTEQSTSRFGGIADIAAGILTAKFAMAAGQAALDAARLAGEFETAGNAFNILTREVDKNTLSLDTLREATMGTVSDIGLLRAANTALAMGLPTDDLTELFHAATVLGNAMGRTALEAVNDLAVGIGRQSRLILDNLGIIVSSDEAYEKYAATLGKTASQLTDVEKKLAWQSEAMAKVTEKAAELEGATSKTQLAFQRAEASVSNWMVTLGKIPAMAVAGWMMIIEDSTEALKQATNDGTKSLANYSVTMGQAEADLYGWGEALVDTTGMAVDATGEYADATDDAAKSEEELRREAEETKRVLLEAAVARQDAITALGPLLTDARLKTGDWEQAERDLADTIRYVTGETSALTTSTEDLAWETRDVEYAYNDLNAQLSDVQGEIRRTTIELAGLEAQQSDLKWTLSELTLEEMKLRDAYLDGRITEEAYKKASGELESQTRDLRIEEYELRLEADRVREKLDSQKTSASDLEEKMDLLVDTNKAMKDAAVAMKEAVDKLNASLEAMGTAAGGTKEELEDLISVYDEYEERKFRSGELPPSDTNPPTEPEPEPSPEPTPTPAPTTRTIYTAMCPYCGFTAESENKQEAIRQVTSHIRSAHPGNAESVTVSSRTVRAASGFEGIVTRPTMMMVGEAGEEKVSVKPLRGPDKSSGEARPRQPINIVLTLDGRVVAEVMHDLQLDEIRSFGYQP